MNFLENLCTKMGCPAACCRDIGFDLSPGEARSFTAGHTVNHIDANTLHGSTIDEVTSVPTGFSVIDNPDDSGTTVHIHLKGPCPHLDKTSFDCGAFGKKQRPGICSEVPIGHPTCDSQRLKKGLLRLRITNG
jgi:hypothetical protein